MRQERKFKRVMLRKAKVKISYLLFKSNFDKNNNFIKTSKVKIGNKPKNKSPPFATKHVFCKTS